MAHHRFTDSLHPVFISSFNKFGKLNIGFFFLALQQLRKLTVENLVEFNFPIQDFLIIFCPVLVSFQVRKLHREVAKFLLVFQNSFLLHQCFFLKILFQREQYLVRIYWFKDIISNLRTNGLLHNGFLFIFGHHYNFNGRIDIFNHRYGFQTGNSRHIFVQQSELKIFFFNHFQCFINIIYRGNFISFTFQKNNMRFK